MTAIKQVLISQQYLENNAQITKKSSISKAVLNPIVAQCYLNGKDYKD